MTEAAYQAARKVMASANHVRGQITAAEGEVGKWTRIEASHRENLRHSQADGAKKMLDKAISKLGERRAKFAAMTFPDSNLTIQENRCKKCGRKLNKEEACECEYS
jgi:hypothetical protein